MVHSFPPGFPKIRDSRVWRLVATLNFVTAYLISLAIIGLLGIALWDI